MYASSYIIHIIIRNKYKSNSYQLWVIYGSNSDIRIKYCSQENVF